MAENWEQNPLDAGPPHIISQYIPIFSHVFLTNLQVNILTFNLKGLNPGPKSALAADEITMTIPCLDS